MSTGSIVSTGADGSEALVRTSESVRDFEDVPSECRTPSFEGPRKRILTAAFASLSASNPQPGQECSPTYSELSVLTSHDAHSFVVSSGSTSTKYVPSGLHLYISKPMKIFHAADAVLRLFPANSSISFASRSSTATNSYSRA